MSTSIADGIVATASRYRQQRETHLCCIYLLTGAIYDSKRGAPTMPRGMTHGEGSMRYPPLYPPLDS